MNNLHERGRKDGTYEFIDNKVRINYKSGVDSVLFEDISSISYKEVGMANNLISLICTAIACLFIYYTYSTGSPTPAFIGVGIIFIGFVLAIALKKYHDNVIIETRGGKLLFYSVEKGQGSIQMDTIESERRNHVK